MTSKTYILTACAVAAVLLCGHFGIHSYFKARQLKAQAESIAVRTRLMKHQIGEMEQKMRILQRVAHFVKQAQDLRLVPGQWAAYEVNIQDVLTFQALSRIVEQCVHSKDIYFKPVAFNVALNHGATNPSGDESVPQPVPMNADASEENASDVTLALQGTFMVRHP
jgi:hypothetical protein